jgi:hypothetical protein
VPSEREPEEAGQGEADRAASGARPRVSRARGVAAWLAHRWVAVACACAALGVLVSFTDFGVTWDEGVQARYGELVLEHVRSAGTDRRYVAYHDLRFYGPALETLLAAVYLKWPAARFEIRHLALGLLAIAMIPTLAAFTRRFGRPAIGPLAVLALLSMPRLLGHAPANSKDVPFALAVACFMTSLAPALVERRRAVWPMLVAGLAAGIALAVRPGALPLLLALLGGALVVAHLCVPFPAPWRERLGLLARWGVAGAVAWGVMVALWPWAHEDPLHHPIAAIRMASDFERVYPVLFDGQTFSSNALPRTYLPTYLLIATPLPLLVLAVAGLLFEGLRVRTDATPGTRFAFGVTVLWLTLPVLLVVAIAPNLYDGLRHFLFVLPALAVLAALGAWHLAARWPTGRAAWLAWAGVVLALTVSWVSIVRLHPYQTSYFNALVGGLPGAAGRFEVDYWASSLGEATRFVNARSVEEGASGRERPLRILLGTTSPYPKVAVQYEASPGIEVWTLAELARWPGEAPEFDFYVAPARYGMQGYFPDAPVVHRVSREGVTLAIVRDMGGAPVRALPAPAAVGGGPSRAHASGVVRGVVRD